MMKIFLFKLTQKTKKLTLIGPKIRLKGEIIFAKTLKMIISKARGMTLTFNPHYSQTSLTGISMLPLITSKTRILPKTQLMASLVLN